MGIGVFSFILGFYFLDNFRTNPKFESIYGILLRVTPFAPIGTLFGTLKESQTSRKKLSVLLLTGLSVIFLVVFIWGSLFATTLD
jgi:hypothetical protein